MDGKIYKLLTVIVLIVTPVVIASMTTEAYESSDHLCDKCECWTNPENKTFYINCTARQMKHVIANWPSEKAKVIVATFSGNALKRLQTFPGSDAVIRVVLDNCGIESLEAGLFKNAKNVQYLDMSHNRIDSGQLSAEVFKGPYDVNNYEPIALEYLNLAYNELHTLHKNVFEHTPYLTHLSLEGNKFRVLDDITTLAFNNIKLLKVLNLAGNMFTDLSDNAVVNFKNLTTLDISRNDLDFVPLSLSVLQSSLRTLIIDDNPIVDLDDEAFLGMTSLLEISLRNLSKLTRVKTGTFSSSPNLRKVDLSNNLMLERIDDSAFENSSRLTELILTNTNLKSLSPYILENWSTLQVFDLSSDQLYCDCYLYNVSTMLSDDIKRNKNGPYCKDIRTSFSQEVYSLTDDVCSKELANYQPNVFDSGRPTSPFKVFFIGLLCVFAIVVCAFSLLLVMKWKSWMRNRSYPYASQVVYNPITTNIQY